MDLRVSKKGRAFQTLYRAGPSGLAAVLLLLAASTGTSFNDDQAPVTRTHVAPPPRAVTEMGLLAAPARPLPRTELASGPTRKSGALSDDETGYAGVSSFERQSATIHGWQYCLAVAPNEKKVFVSAAFPQGTDLKLTQALFANAISEVEHDPVQCPVSKYPGTSRTMRADAIGFNRKVGNAVVSLNWQPLTVSSDEDPIEAAIYTGNSSTENPELQAAWRYCFAQSYDDKKAYFSAPFAKTSTLHASETEFAMRLIHSKIKYDTVQCPNSADESSISAMRDHAIGFNQERGQVIVTLSSESQS